jgi:hypothetical protein
MRYTCCTQKKDVERGKEGALIAEKGGGDGTETTATQMLRPLPNMTTAHHSKLVVTIHMWKYHDFKA